MALTSTGHGATLTMATSGFTALFTTLGGFEQAREALDTSHLGTLDWRTKIPGDLVDPGAISGTFWYDVDSQPPITGAPEEITLTFPLTDPVKTNAAKVVGDAFVTNSGTPSLETDTLMAGEMEVTWAGEPTYTDES